MKSRRSFHLRACIHVLFDLFIRRAWRARRAASLTPTHRSISRSIPANISAINSPSADGFRAENQTARAWLRSIMRRPAYPTYRVITCRTLGDLHVRLSLVEWHVKGIPACVRAVRAGVCEGGVPRGAHDRLAGHQVLVQRCIRMRVQTYRIMMERLRKPPQATI